MAVPRDRRCRVVQSSLHNTLTMFRNGFLFHTKYVDGKRRRPCTSDTVVDARSRTDRKMDTVLTRNCLVLLFTQTHRWKLHPSKITGFTTSDILEILVQNSCV